MSSGKCRPSCLGLNVLRLDMSLQSHHMIIMSSQITSNLTVSFKRLVQANNKETCALLALSESLVESGFSIARGQWCGKCIHVIMPSCHDQFWEAIFGNSFIGGHHGCWSDYHNSLWLSTLWWSRSTLAQVMACCLMAPSHYLNHVDWLSVRSCGIQLKAIWWEVFMNLICNICFKIICSKITSTSQGPMS